MRIDQFLWFSRIFKSRTIASNACKKGHIKKNSKSLKPSDEVYPNMTINVKKNQINYTYTIKDLPNSRVGAKIVNLYINLNKNNFKYDGKPSKKDRRDLKNYLND